MQKENKMIQKGTDWLLSYHLYYYLKKILLTSRIKNAINKTYFPETFHVDIFLLRMPSEISKEYGGKHFLQDNCEEMP